MSYLMLIAGFVVLAATGDFLVHGAVLLANRLGISPLIIGLTIVAFGTSAPELVVSLQAALTGSSSLAIGNVVGSNIANVLLVLGLPAIIRAATCSDKHMERNVAFMLGASFLFAGLCWLGPLHFWHGALLFTLLLVFLLYSYSLAFGNGRNNVEFAEEAEELIKESGEASKSMPLTLLLIGIGIIGLPLGAKMTVDGASEIAATLGVSKAAIGLTAVALGTSLPELVTTISCTLRGHGGMAFGNVLGSNMFNILAVMGVTAMVANVPVPDAVLHVDIWVMLGTALLVAPYALNKLCMTRVHGVMFVLAYMAYIALVLAPQFGHAGG
ncbi:MAG: sodium:proton exchanger [Hyphomicrobiales bacterium]|nr:MAG: sodium:proton exchanger [Hyphomicrobiales bacterium]